MFLHLLNWCWEYISGVYKMSFYVTVVLPTNVLARRCTTTRRAWNG